MQSTEILRWENCYMKKNRGVPEAKTYNYTFQPFDLCFCNFLMKTLFKSFVWDKKTPLCSICHCLITLNPVKEIKSRNYQCEVTHNLNWSMLLPISSVGNHRKRIYQTTLKMRAVFRNVELFSREIIFSRGSCRTKTDLKHWIAITAVRQIKNYLH